MRRGNKKLKNKKLKDMNKDESLVFYKKIFLAIFVLSYSLWFIAKVFLSE